MKKCISLFLSLALCLGLTAPAALAAESPAVSRNARKQDQTSLSASPITSHIFENEAGGLTRVEYIDGQIVVEDYSSDFIFQSGRTIPMELSIWGGFFAGADYNFFVFGQQNIDENDSVEVIRVVKYSKDWERLGQASLQGANTTVPFDFGSLRCAEYGGELYIRTCHEMYTTDDGLNHQANLTLCVDQDSMAVLDSYYRAMNKSVGYVSHSLNQFVLVDQDGTIVTMDHGDAHPRAAVLMKYQTKAGNGAFSGRVSETTIQTFADQDIYQFTGASLGGLAETSSGYVAAYNYDSTGNGSSTNRTTYLAYVPKRSNTASVKPVFSAGATTPQLVSTGLSGGYVLWNGKQDKIVTDTLYYASYDSEGNVGTVQTALGLLSDCAPICYNGRVVWYATDNAAPVFYTLDESGVTQHSGQAPQKPPVSEEPGEDQKPNGTQKPNDTQRPDKPDGTTKAVFTDVPTTHWAYGAVASAYADGVIAGTYYNESTGERRFSPDASLSAVEWLTILTRAFYGDEVKASESTGTWYAANLEVANNHSLIQGIDVTHLDNALTRAEMAWTVYSIMLDMGVDMPDYETLISYESKIADWSDMGPGMHETVATAYHFGIIGGVDANGTFNPEGTFTRAQAAVVYTRLKAVIDNMESKKPVPPVEPEKPVETEKPGSTVTEQSTAPESQGKPSTSEKPVEPKLSNGENINDKNIQNILYSIEADYPEGMPWTNDNYYHSNALNRGGYGCEGFGLICSDKVFGDMPITAAHSDFDRVRAGDLIRMNHDTHTVIVLEKRTNSVIVAEGNYNSSIHWGREINRETLENGDFSVRTRYPE